jgi:hypothetical protein
MALELSQQSYRVDFVIILLPRVIFFRYLIYTHTTISMIGNVDIDW